MKFSVVFFGLLFSLSAESFESKQKASCSEALKFAKAECILWDDRIDIYSFDEDCLFDVMSDYGYETSSLIPVYEDDVQSSDPNDYTCFSN